MFAIEFLHFSDELVAELTFHQNAMSGRVGLRDH